MVGRQKKSDRKMLKAGDLARREDHWVRGVKSGRTRADRGISHVCLCNLLKNSVTVDVFALNG